MLRALTLLSPSLLVLACSSAPDVVKPPVMTPKPAVSTATPVAEPPISAELVGPEMGSSFEVDPSEPLPNGAVARLGTTKMRVAHSAALAISDSGKIWAVDDVEGRNVLRDVVEGKDVKELPSSRNWLIAPDARWVAGVALNDPGRITFYEVPSARVLGSVTVPLPEHTVVPKKGKPSKVRAWILDLMVSADGLGVVAVTNDGAVHAIDPATFKLEKTIKVSQTLHLSSLSAKAKRGLFIEMEHSPGVLALSSYGSNFGYAVLDLSTGSTVRKETFKKLPVDTFQPNAGRSPEHAHAAFGISVDGAKVYRNEYGDVAAIDLATGKETTIKKGHSDLLSFRLGSGNFVALANGELAVTDGEVISLDGATKRQLKDMFVAASPDSNSIVERRGSAYFRSPTSLKIRDGADSRVEDLAFLPDGRTLVASDGAPIFWDTLTGKTKAKPKVRSSFVVSARSKPALLLGGYEPLVVDENGKTRKLASVHSPTTAAFSPDASKLFLSVGDDDDGPEQLGVISLASGGAKPEKTRSFGEPVYRIDMAEDGRALLVSVGRRYGESQSALEIVDPSSLATKKRVEVDSVGYVAFAGDKIVEVSDSGGIVVRSRASLEKVGRMKRGMCCSSAAVSPNGKLVAGALGRSVAVWDVDSRKLVGVARGHREAVESVAFSPDSRFLATGSRDTTVLLWKVEALPKGGSQTTVETVGVGDEAAKTFNRGSDAYSIGAQGTLEKANPKWNGKVPPITGVEQVISMGASHCVISRGKVQCWGYSHGGVLGVPEERDAKQRVTAKAQPVTVSGVKDPVALFGRGTYVCALEKSADLICWGKLDYSSTPTSPTKVLSGVKTAAIGLGRACALDSAGGAHCWTSTQSPAVVPVKDVISIALGYHHACLLDKDGKVRCFGDNDSDQLGDGSGVNRTEPVLAVGLGDVTSIRADGNSSCAITKKKEVYCWGELPEPGFAPTPTRLPDLDGSTEIRTEYRRVCGHIGDKAVCVKFERD